ncbi:MAG TPA: imidazolonepropionase [Acidothermaceae bacterium]
MASIRFDNIATLVTNDPANDAGDGSPLGVIHDASMVIEGDQVSWVGHQAHPPDADVRVDLDGQTVIPGFVDSHSHLVFGGDRVEEFAARMSATPYTAGGIATTVAATRSADSAALQANARRLVAEMAASGTTTVEIKGGYGLTTHDEVRSQSIAHELTSESTFLGAHVVPPEFHNRRDDYVALVAGEMLDACASSARWIDVFCDRGAFDVDEARLILEAGVAKGLVPRLHAHQLSRTGAVELGVALVAASVDHCNAMNADDLDVLAGSSTLATVLPGADFSTRSRYADARRMIDAGIVVAIATDCNPGTSYTTSMPFCIAVAVRDMRLTPAEALWAATAAGARALRRDDIGVLAVGMSADFAVVAAPSYVHLVYRPGVALVSATWKSGSQIVPVQRFATPS